MLSFALGFVAGFTSCVVCFYLVGVMILREARANATVQKVKMAEQVTVQLRNDT